MADLRDITSIVSVPTAGNNIPGTPLIIASGPGTGTGGGGALIFQTAPSGATGTTPNAQATALTITSGGVLAVATATASTSTATGALVVAGGVGIAGAVNAAQGGFGSPTLSGKSLASSGEAVFFNGTFVDPDSGVARAIKIGAAGLAVRGGIKTDSLTVTGTDGISLTSATSNLINLGTAGVAAPSFTTRSPGTKITLHDNLSSGNATYAIGIESGAMWHTVGTTANSFKWYGGTTLAATLTGTGNLTLPGTISAEQELRFGNQPEDRWGRLQITSSAATRYGFSSEYGSDIVLTNEQGIGNQALFLGDSSAGATNTVFGISRAAAGSAVTTGAEVWTALLDLRADGSLLLPLNVASTTTGTGTLIAAGGIGAAGAINAGGMISTANQLRSTVATGTAPLAVTSTTAVTNLNADLLDGQHASAFIMKGENVDTTLGSSTDNRAAVLTLNHTHTLTWAANGDPGDSNRTLTAQNPTTDTTANKYAVMSMQVSPSLSVPGGRVIGDIKLVRTTANSGNGRLVFSVTNGSGFTDLLSIDKDAITHQGNTLWHAGNLQRPAFGFPWVNAGTSTAQWVRLGTFSHSSSGDKVQIRVYCGAGYNALNSQDAHANIFFKRPNGTSFSPEGFSGNSSWYRTGRSTSAITEVKWVANAAGAAATAYTLYLNLGLFQGVGSYEVIPGGGTWAHDPLSDVADPGVASATVLIPADEYVLQSPPSFYGDASFSGTASFSKAVSINPGVQVNALDLNNNNLVGVNNIVFADSGANEGLEWAGGSGWKLYESPDNLTNASGNLQFVTNSTRRATITTTGDVDATGTISGTRLISTVAAGTAPLTVTSTTTVANLNADLLDGQHGSHYNDAANLTGTVADARLSGLYTGMGIKLGTDQTVFSGPSTGTQHGVFRSVLNLASYRNSSGAAVGAIVFIAPNTSSSHMVQFEVKGDNHSTAHVIHFVVRGYRTTGTWGSLRKVNYGTLEVAVRLGVTADGRNCLIVGDIDTTWSYPALTIVNAILSHGTTDAYCYGWTSALATDLSAYTNVTSTIGSSPQVSDITASAITSGTLSLSSTTASSSSTTGALVVAGGLGLGGALYAAGTVRADVGGGANSATSALQASNGAYYIGLYPRMSAGNYNSLVASGDSGIIFSTGAQNAGNLVIGPWTNTSGGVGLKLQADGNHTLKGATLSLDGTVVSTSTVSGTQLISTVANGTAPMTVVSSTRVNNLYASRADTLATARTIAVTGHATGTATSFNGSANISVPITSINPVITQPALLADYADYPTGLSIISGGAPAEWPNYVTVLTTNVNSNRAFQLIATKASEQLYWRSIDASQASTWAPLRKLWHEGNDGASSGLDADLLDGQQGSHYLDLANATGNLTTNLITMSGGTSNHILFNTTGVGFPTTTSRSAGTKITLFSNLSATDTEYAIGVGSNTLWNSVPSSARSFHWYAATNNIATLTGTGNLSLSGSITADASPATYTIAATGAAPRTIAARLGDVVNVSDFGAVGNGTADDTAAIQAAINHVRTRTQGGTVVLSGLHRVTGEIDCYPSVPLTLDFQGGRVLVDYTGAASVVFRGTYRNPSTTLLDPLTRGQPLTFQNAEIRMHGNVADGQIGAVFIEQRGSSGLRFIGHQFLSHYRDNTVVRISGLWNCRLGATAVWGGGTQKTYKSSAATFSIGLGGTTLTASAATFAAGDVGRAIALFDNSYSPGPQCFTIASYVSTTQVTVTEASARAFAAAAGAFGGALGALTNASATLTADASIFTAADVGRVVYVHDGYQHFNGLVMPMRATITAYTSATQVTLDRTANRTASGLFLTFSPGVELYTEHAEWAQITNDFAWHNLHIEQYRGTGLALLHGYNATFDNLKVHSSQSAQGNTRASQFNILMGNYGGFINGLMLDGTTINPQGLVVTSGQTRGLMISNITGSPTIGATLVHMRGASATAVTTVGPAAFANELPQSTTAKLLVREGNGSLHLSGRIVSNDAAGTLPHAVFGDGVPASTVRDGTAIVVGTAATGAQWQSLATQGPNGLVGLAIGGTPEAPTGVADFRMGVSVTGKAMATNGTIRDLGGLRVRARSPTADDLTGDIVFNTRASGTTADRLILQATGLHPSANAAMQLGTASLRYYSLHISNIIDNNGTQWLTTTAAPEGSVTAPAGSFHTNSSGGATALSVKQSGTGNTGWIGLAPIDGPTFTGTVTAPTVVVSGTSASTSTATGALRVAGGISTGAGSFFSSESRFTNGTFVDPQSGTARAIKVGSAGIAVRGGTYTDTLAVAATTAATSTTTGALTVAGGAGIVGNLHVGGTLTTGDTGRTVNVFTGTGAQTAFTLSKTTGTYDVIASVGGIVLTPGVDYTVSGTTLTFTVAPDLNADVWAMVLGTTPGGISGNIVATADETITGNWTFANRAMLKATGALVTRAMNDRFADTINAKDYGALGDGVTDDTMALQAALTASTTLQKALYIPGGTYRLSAQLTMSNGPLSIYGDGMGVTILRWSIGSTTLGIYGSFNNDQQITSIRDMSFWADTRFLGTAIHLDYEDQIVRNTFGSVPLAIGAVSGSTYIAVPTHHGTGNEIVCGTAIPPHTVGTGVTIASSATTTAAAGTTSTTLSVASSAGITVGMGVVDYTNSARLAPNTRVLAVSGTTITLSIAPIVDPELGLNGVVAGDGLQFTLFHLTLSQATTEAIAAGTIIDWDNPVTVNRSTPRGVFTNLSIRGATGAFNDGWDSGIVLVHGLQFVVTNLNFEGCLGTHTSDYQSTYGVVLMGRGHPVQLNVADSTFLYTKNSVAGINIEGLLVYNCTFVGVGRGVVFDDSSYAYGARPHCLVHGCHINAGIACVYFLNGTELICTDNDLYLVIDATGPGYAVYCNGVWATAGVISGNMITNSSAAQPQTGIYLERMNNVIIDQNNFRKYFTTGVSNGIYIGPNCHGTVIGEHNIFSADWSQINVTAAANAAGGATSLTLAHTNGMIVGMYIVGTNIPINTTITGVAGNVVYLSQGLLGAGVSAGAAILVQGPLGNFGFEIQDQGFATVRPNINVTVYKNASQSITGGAGLTLMHWDAPSQFTPNSGGNWSLSQPGRLTVAVDGFYRVSANIIWDETATGWREVIINKNGGGSVGMPNMTSAAASGMYVKQSITSSQMFLKAGEYVECYVATSVTAVVLANNSCWFSFERIGS